MSAENLSHRIKKSRALSGRDDQQLAGLLDEAAVWFAKGSHGIVLGRAESLREAIEAVVEFGVSEHIISLVRGASEDIVVFSHQLERLVMTHGRTGSMRTQTAAGRRRELYLKLRI
jgi:hypothetical protein